MSGSEEAKQSANELRALKNRESAIVILERATDPPENWSNFIGRREQTSVGDLETPLKQGVFGRLSENRPPSAESELTGK